MYRPHVIQTPVFGQTWQMATTFKKQAQHMAPLLSTPQAYQGFVAQKIGIHVIQIINTEVIAAGLDNSN
jgi:hypothetical protein